MSPQTWDGCLSLFRAWRGLPAAGGTDRQQRKEDSSVGGPGVRLKGGDWS